MLYNQNEGAPYTGTQHTCEPYSVPQVPAKFLFSPACARGLCSLCALLLCCLWVYVCVIV